MNKEELRMKVHCDAGERCAQGSKKHGAFDPFTDGRDRMQDAYEEALDCLNYVMMERFKLMHRDPAALEERSGDLATIYNLAMEIGVMILEYKHKPKGLKQSLPTKERLKKCR